MSERALKVLLIDDDEDDYLITRDLLSEVRGTRYEITWLSSSESALAELRAGQHDVCLLDYRLGGVTGLELLTSANSAGCAIPIIMLTGAADEKVDLAAMSAGAADYLVKGRLDAQILERTIRYAIGHKKSQLALRQYAETLEQSNRNLVQMHEELARKNAELTRLNEEKNRFLGMAAHDLRNPLGVILGYSDFLLMNRRRAQGPRRAAGREEAPPRPGGAESRPMLKDNEVDIVEMIRSSSKFMLSLINDLLDLSTIESGKLRLDRKRTDIVRLVELNIALNAVLAEQKNMELLLTAEAGVPLIDVDARKVEQVLNNLISNAIHYSPAGTTIRVGVRGAEAASGGQEVTISVADEGPGIAAEDLDKLFRPFGRAKSVSTGGERSTGLGLAIARRIVEGHGGRIWVESELGRGSTFHVAFPVGEPREAAPAAEEAFG